MSLTAVEAGAYLHHLHFRTPAPETLARFYASAMDMTAAPSDEGWLCRGPGRRMIFSKGPAKLLVHAAFGVRDTEALSKLHARATAEGLAPKPMPRGLFEAGFSVVDPDGNAIAFGLSADEPPAKGIRGPIQHVTLQTRDIAAIEAFYHGKLGFAVTDYVVDDAGKTMTCFMTSNHEHHTLGVFYKDQPAGVDHHSYEAGEWGVIKDWCDRFGDQRIQLMWGPGRHGPGNNLFIFIVDPDGNWIEISAELEVMYGRPARTWRHEERTLNLWGKGILRA